MLNEDSLDAKRWFVFPVVVNKGDDADALNPHPKLSAGLWLVLSGDVKSHGGNVNVGFQSLKNMW